MRIGRIASFVITVSCVATLATGLVHSPSDERKPAAMSTNPSHPPTGPEVKHLGPMPVNRLMPDMRVPPHPIIADGLVHAAGTPVAAVVAESVYAARDAVELIRVEYEPLPALATPEAAVADGAPVLFPDIEGNRSFTRTLRAGDPICTQAIRM